MSKKAIQAIDIRPADPEKQVGVMSGGNQQKVVLGKWLMRDRKVLTLDEEVIVKEAQAHAEAIYKRAGIVLPDRFHTIR